VLVLKENVSRSVSARVVANMDGPMVAISVRWRMKRLNIGSFKPLSLLGFYALCSHRLGTTFCINSRLWCLLCVSLAFMRQAVLLGHIEHMLRIDHWKVMIARALQHRAFSACYVLAPIALGPLYLLPVDVFDTGSVANSADRVDNSASDKFRRLQPNERQDILNFLRNL
jgi:hypothetical protein